MKAIPILRGVDTSNNNLHPIDWNAVKRDGYSFAVVKSSEGCGFADEDFALDWATLPQASLSRACYHFALPDRNYPLQEAGWFLHVVPHLADYDIVVLDAERGGPQLGAAAYSAWALAWLGDVEQALKTPPLLYCNEDYALNYLTDPRLARYPLWLALPNAQQCPARIGVWSEVAIWQNSWVGHVSGIQGDADTNVCARTMDQFHQLGKQPVTPPPLPPTMHKYLVLIDMRARAIPTADSSFWPPWYCYRGAVLDGTGQTNGDWTQVVAGGRACWLLTANLKQV